MVRLGRGLPSTEPPDPTGSREATSGTRDSNMPTTNADLGGDAASAIGDAIDGMHRLDLAELRDKTSEAVFRVAENAVTYTSDALDIIGRYESHPAAMDADDRLVGMPTYTADKWIDAMTAYACAIATCVIEADAWALLDTVGERADMLAEKAREFGDPEHGAETPHVSARCPYGWARHDREDADGVHYWSEQHLEGCRAVAVRVAGIWLFHTWTPAAVTAEATSENETTDEGGAE